MAWIYLAESEDSPLHLKNGYGQSPTVKTTAIVNPYFLAVWGQVGYRPRQFGMTFSRSMEKSFQGFPSTSFTADSLARTSVLLAAKKAWQESEADYFSRSYGSFAKFDHNSSSWKMSQELLPFLEPLPENWPRQGMIVDGECFELMKWERRISENDGGVLPTPVAYDATPGGPNNHYQGLGQMAKKQQWPTPMASQASRGDCPAERRRKTPGLESAVKMETLEFGKLNPTWVEWLMGYDLEWTALKDWATQWFLSKRGKRLKDLSVSKQPTQENKK